MPVSCQRCAKFRDRREALSFHFLCFVWDVLLLPVSYAWANLACEPLSIAPMAAPAALPWFIIFFWQNRLFCFGETQQGSRAESQWVLAVFLLFRCLCVLLGLKHDVLAFSLCELRELRRLICECWTVHGRTGKLAPLLGASVPESLRGGLC